MGTEIDKRIEKVKKILNKVQAEHGSFVLRRAYKEVFGIKVKEASQN